MKRLFLDLLNSNSVYNTYSLLVIIFVWIIHKLQLGKKKTCISYSLIFDKTLLQNELNAIAPPQDGAPPLQEEDAPLQEEDAPPSDDQESK